MHKLDNYKMQLDAKIEIMNPLHFKTKSKYFSTKMMSRLLNPFMPCGMIEEIMAKSFKDENSN